jgi:Txe/YoeB family toxin of Txe-Axe toxin-antitoxin module
VFELEDFKTIEDLEKIAENEKIVYLLKNVVEDYFSKLFELEDFNIKYLERVAKNEDIVYLLKNYEGNNILDILKFIENNYSFNKVKNPEKIKNNLFTVKSR